MKMKTNYKFCSFLPSEIQIMNTNIFIINVEIIEMKLKTKWDTLWAHSYSRALAIVVVVIYVFSRLMVSMAPFKYFQKYKTNWYPQTACSGWAKVSSPNETDSSIALFLAYWNRFALRLRRCYMYAAHGVREVIMKFSISCGGKRECIAIAHLTSIIQHNRGETQSTQATASGNNIAF